jgi:ParB family chromosome partitioning protein
MEKKRALGRGLDALLPTAPKASAPAYGDKSVFLCAIEKVRPQKGQPRQHFDARALDELAQSIKEHGLIEPLVVRRVEGGVLELIAGERRWRAAQKAGLREVMVVVKDISPKGAFELALIENVQREDLNPIELAEAFERLVREHGYTQDKLAVRLGKDRTTVTNVLRLLRLPVRVRQKVVTGELSEGHARALLGASDDRAIGELADKVLRGKLSVRATEALVRLDAAKGNKAKGKAQSSPSAGKGKTANMRDLETRLGRKLGTKVEVRDKGGKGEIAIPYPDLDALDRLLDRLL